MFVIWFSGYFLRAKLNCETKGIKYTDHGLSWERPGIGQMVLYMFVEAVVLFILVLLIEVRPRNSRRLVSND